MLTALHHVQVAMPPGGEDKARAFYGQLLELPERAKPADLAKSGGCWFEQGQLRLHCGVDPEFRPNRKAHPAFCSDDWRGLRARLADAGYEPADHAPVDGRSRFFVDDPFGNRIEFLGPALA